MRNIGDKVWVAHCDGCEPTIVICPDCGGTRRIRAIMHDETVHSVACEGCSRGYEPPCGYLKVHTVKAYAREQTITGVTISGDGIEYTTNCTIVNEREVFDTGAEALERAKANEVWLNVQEMCKLNAREIPEKSWAWNVAYHRREIRRLEKELEYNRTKLSWAAFEVKETKRLANVDIEREWRTERC